MTLHLQTRAKRVPKAKPYNKKQAINSFVKKYQFPFEMKDDSIDLREMAKNYPNEIIPVDDIHQAILTVLGPNYVNRPIAPYDPSGGASIHYAGYTLSPRMIYVAWNEIYLWPIFQRDVDPNHVKKIDSKFNHTTILAPCAIKITLKNGEPIYCVWDGHHTIQTCKLQNYQQFPLWFVDIDHIPLSVIENAGFGDTDAERIKFGIWLAGTNMRMINSTMKKDLSPYDDYLIGYETRDSKFVAMMNILKANSCVPKRSPSVEGAWTQIKSGIECFDLEGPAGPSNGTYWARALAFHRKHWTKSYLVLELFRPMTYLYQWAAVQGFSLPASFDDELAQMLISEWGDAESIQECIKESYWTAVNNKTLIGEQPQHDKFRVLNGLINFYKQKGGKVLLPAPTCQWTV
jgi:hypothetical protein